MGFGLFPARNSQFYAVHPAFLGPTELYFASEPCARLITFAEVPRLPKDGCVGSLDAISKVKRSF